MGRFYLHLRVPEFVAEDEEGLDLPSVEAAKDAAVENIRSILAEDVRKGKLNLSGIVEVVEERGSTVAVVPFEEAVQIER